MIAYFGSSMDRVYPRFIHSLENSGQPFAFVDEDNPGAYTVAVDNSLSAPSFRITGGACTGDRPVSGIFVRHAVARSLDSHAISRLSTLQMQLNTLLAFCLCPVINPPHFSFSNYSKPYQIRLLAAAGFDTPRTLVTNHPQTGRRFYQKENRQVIVKGVSNSMTLAQRLTPEKLARLSHLPDCPTQFQELIPGEDFRVHVVGERTFVTRLVSENEDYRRSLIGRAEVEITPAELPQDILDRCVAFTRSLGLVVSGIDFKGYADGRLVALELNPFPQFTFYEGSSGVAVSSAIIDYLVSQTIEDHKVFV